MTLNRITVTLTTLIAALFALLVIAGLVGSSAGAANAATTGRSSHSSALLLPWHRAAVPTYAKVVYHPHQMCDQLHPKAMAPALKP